MSRYLAQRRDPGPSVESSNHYLAAIKEFCNWLVEHRRLSANPLACRSSMNARANRVHVRRALEPDELRALLSTAQTGPDRHGMSGTARLWLYRLAVESGLRSNELHSLTRASFQLGDEPSVVIEAVHATGIDDAGPRLCFAWRKTRQNDAQECAAVQRTRRARANRNPLERQALAMYRRALQRMDGQPVPAR